MEGCLFMNWGGGIWLVVDKEIIFIRKGNVYWCFIKGLLVIFFDYVLICIFKGYLGLENIVEGL